MGELGFNKIFGAILAVALTIFGLKELSAITFGTGGHHHHEHYESKNEWAKKKFAYYTDIAETGGASDEPEEIYDLGLLLASADASRGERSFKGKCATCHTIAEGGANGTGPNLYNSIYAGKQNVASFNYSGVLAAVGGEWTYEAMDDWLRAPSRYARGTSMAFAGINRDTERADVIAYLTSFTPDAPAFPDPLPEVVDEAALDVEEIEGAVLEEAAGDAATTDSAVIEADAAETTADAVETAADAVSNAADSAIVETLDEATDITVEDVVEEAVDAVEGATGE